MSNWLTIYLLDFDSFLMSEKLLKLSPKHLLVFQVGVMEVAPSICYLAKLGGFLWQNYFKYTSASFDL